MTALLGVASLAPGACDLAGGDVDAVEEVGCGDREDEGCERFLVVVAGGFLPDRARRRVQGVATVPVVLVSVQTFPKGLALYCCITDDPVLTTPGA